MKITVKQTIEKTIELPKFFKMLNHTYYMILDEETCLVVKDFPNDNSVVSLFPLIERMRISYHESTFISFGFTEITEQEFKDAFIRTHLQLEEMMN